SPAKGSNKAKKRLGRGIGSWGKTAGKGHKGQKARKGGKVRPGFEGGQMPLYRRLPKRGFTNIFRVEFAVVNIGDLNRFDGKEKITPELLDKAGLIDHKTSPVKLLGRGKLEKGLTVVVHKASKTAAEAIAKAGGKVEFIEERLKNKTLTKKSKKEREAAKAAKR